MILVCVICSRFVVIAVGGVGWLWVVDLVFCLLSWGFLCAVCLVPCGVRVVWALVVVGCASGRFCCA